ncbi:MAG: hypothetical protein J3R72DRAFT_523512 [Linnemannia gamsii]|nr:MAG: hypothetical protein J3R72DRAFT_523512 [Linnemannia gamsii]
MVVAKDLLLTDLSGLRGRLPLPSPSKSMSLKSYILQSFIFQRVFSLSVWFIVLGIPFILIATFLYYTAKGTGNVAGVLVDKTAKRVRSYQQEQRRREGQKSPVSSGVDGGAELRQRQYRTGGVFV